MRITFASLSPTVQPPTRVNEDLFSWLRYLLSLNNFSHNFSTTTKLQFVSSRYNGGIIKHLCQSSRMLCKLLYFAAMNEFAHWQTTIIWISNNSAVHCIPSANLCPKSRLNILARIRVFVTCRKKVLWNRPKLVSSVTGCSLAANKQWRITIISRFFQL